LEADTIQSQGISGSPDRPGLLKSLGRLVRGLSAIFWGLPLALVIGVQTARSDWLRHYGFLPLLAANGLLLFGLWEMGRFQPRERIWTSALDRTKLLGIINIGLSPFLYWWYQAPRVLYFACGSGVLILSALFFLYDLNNVLKRLTSMLPDATLRQETHLFSTLNMVILLVAAGCFMAGFSILNLDLAPHLAARLEFLLTRGLLWLMIFLILLPVAMTMAMLWKIKEVILEGVFTSER